MQFDQQAVAEFLSWVASHKGDRLRFGRSDESPRGFYVVDQPVTAGQVETWAGNWLEGRGERGTDADALILSQYALASAMHE